MTQAPAGDVGPQKPHRGVLILVMGILSFVLSCFVFGIIAWVLGNGDLKEMDAGRMDPSGRGLTQAGRILGIINVGLTALVIVFYLLFIVVLGMGAMFGAGQSGP